MKKIVLSFVCVMSLSFASTSEDKDSMKNEVLKLNTEANLLIVKFTRMVLAPETMRSDAVSKSKLVAFINSFEESIVFKRNNGLQI